MLIRRATEADAGRIAELFRDGTPASFRPLTILGCPGYARYLRAQIAAGARGGDHHYWVAEAGDAVTAAAELRQLDAAWFLNNIHVDRRLRGQGVGARLLAVAADAGRAGGHHTLALDVFASNEPAWAWYRRLGLEEQSRSAYRVVHPPREDAPGGVISGLPQARALLDAFGFAQVTVRGDGTYPVGLLGDEWFRVSEPGLLDDTAAVSVLRRLDPHRQFLLVAPAEGPLPGAAEIVGEALRMSGPLEAAARALARPS